MILGRGEYTANKELVKKLGLSDKVSFTGVKKNPFAYVAKSDMYVLASNHEGFPNALLEGMALGKPVVSTDCKTGPREILLSEEEYEDLIRRIPDGSSIKEPIEGNYGILVPDMDAEVNMDPAVITDGERVLAAEIKRVLDSDELRKKLSGKAGVRAESFTPQKYKNAIHDILKKYE